MKRTVIISLVFALMLAFALSIVIVDQTHAKALYGKTWICHLDGHLGGNFFGNYTELADYVICAQAGYDACIAGGGTPIEISRNACKAHIRYVDVFNRLDAQLNLCETGCPNGFR